MSTEATSGTEPAPCHWLTTIALFTAVLGLGTAGVTFVNEMRKSEEQASEVVVAKQQAAQREAERVAQERAALCRSHLGRSNEIEADFAALLEDHGTLLHFTRQCSAEPDFDTRRGCMALICATAYAATGGESNCVSVALEADRIRASLGRVREASRRDNCPLPTSPAMAYFGHRS